MRKNICALIVVLLILLMMGCAAATKDAADVETEDVSTKVNVEREDETTERSTAEEAVDENTDTLESTEDDKEESEQEPELSEEEKHAALLEKINTQQETCKMLNDMNTGNKYSCFYDEKTNILQFRRFLTRN